jgi:hypothetical protein
MSNGIVGRESLSFRVRAVGWTSHTAGSLNDRHARPTIFSESPA